jgi:branched-chain amino acid transport system ATP-binding protein
MIEGAHVPTALVVEGLRAGYGSMEAVAGVDLEVRSGEMVSLVGRNGAGKTTCLLAVAGVRYGRNAGAVRLGDRNLSKASPPAVVEAGLSHVPEGHRIFRHLDVHENLVVGSYVRRRDGQARVRAAMDRVFDLFPILRTYERRNAGFLSGGEQQMLAIGQALMSEPRILMLDEPTSGLSVMVTRTILEALARLRDEGMGILMVDQSVQRALENSSRCYVMEQGRIVISGNSDELALNERVFEIVRGTDEAGTAGSIAGSHRATGSSTSA